MFYLVIVVRLRFNGDISLFKKGINSLLAALSLIKRDKKGPTINMLSNLELVILSSVAVNENQIKQHMGQKHKVYF